MATCGRHIEASGGIALLAHGWVRMRETVAVTGLVAHTGRAARCSVTVSPRVVAVGSAPDVARITEPATAAIRATGLSSRLGDNPQSHTIAGKSLILGMPPTHTDEGLRAAQEIRNDHPQTAVLVLSQHLGVELRAAPDR